MDLEEFLRRGGCKLPPVPPAQAPGVQPAIPGPPGRRMDFGSFEKGWSGRLKPPHPRRDQGDLPTCASSAIATGLEIIAKDAPLLSASFNYRMTAGNNAPDAEPLYVEPCLMSAAEHGLCKDANHPPDAATSKDEPSLEARLEAQAWRLGLKGSGYRTVVLPELQRCLQRDCPIVLAFALSDGYRAVQEAAHVHGAVEGVTDKGHAVLIIGLENGQFRVRDSYATSKTDEGEWWLPVAVLQDPLLRATFWSINKMRSS